MSNTIKARGTIKITETDTSKVTISAVYDAADILAALRNGESINSIVARLENVQYVDTKPATPERLPYRI